MNPKPAIDAAGWAAGARRGSSPNCDARPAGCEIELAVVHGISLPPGQFGGDGIEKLFANASADPELASMRVSAHFLIRRGGELIQFVSCEDRAWHAGPSSFGGRIACNDFSVGIELEGTCTQPYERAQYERLADLLLALRERYTRLAHVLGHSDIAPLRKDDPGESFQWQQLAALVGEAFCLPQQRQ